MKLRWLLLTGGPLLWTVAASADATAPAHGAAGPAAGPASCIQAATSAQSLRAAHKLVEAREALRLCSRESCPHVVVKDCTRWLDAVEQSLPTVVISTRDRTGRDLLDVTVAVDGVALTSSMPGAAVPMNPGIHLLRFERAGGVVLEREILAPEGAKNQSVSVVLPEPTPTPPPPLDRAPPQTEAQIAAPEAPSPAGTGPWPTLGWVSVAAGVAGLGTGAALGIAAIADRNGAHCDSSHACDAAPLAAASNLAMLSTVAFVAGGALLAGGAALVLLAPRPAEPSVALALSPRVGLRDAGLALEGSW